MNLRPPACKAGALPAELSAHLQQTPCISMSYINTSFIAFVKFTLFSTKMREFWPQIGPKNLSNFKLWWNGMPHPVDGFPDLVVHFEVENIDLEAGDTEATLTGKLFPGSSLSSRSSIRPPIVPGLEINKPIHPVPWEQADSPIAINPDWKPHVLSIPSELAGRPPYG